MGIYRDIRPPRCVFLHYTEAAAVCPAKCKPMPFEYDIVKQNTRAGNTLKAFAYFAAGNMAAADACIEKAANLDANDFTVYTYRQLKKLL